MHSDEDSSISQSKSFNAPTATKETAASPTHSCKKVELNDGSASNDARESNDISAEAKGKKKTSTYYLTFHFSFNSCMIYKYLALVDEEAAL